MSASITALELPRDAGRPARPASVLAVAASTLLFLVLCNSAHAFTFEPTEMEFAAWPPYCKARYSTTMKGKTTVYSDAVSRALIEDWRKRLGERTFVHMHHYCAGIALLNRAKTSSSKHARDVLLEDALSNTAYTYERVKDLGSSVVAQIAVTLAAIREEMGEPDIAEQILQGAIDRQPLQAAPYGALSVFYRRTNRLELARDTLLKGDTATQGKSADLQYNLGLINLELGDVDAAVEYAKRAYSVGYPLEGLRKKLKERGRSVE